ncbi:hypothetical protein [Enterococcus villorum]|uniref:Uncharacterized protein n=1 Tax=Enterococcus villorum TaxID=112904 RepID=A0A511J3Q6_9ENTE|nr:hypothetical protein EVI01_19620 [Enterococcus villorum]
MKGQVREYGEKTKNIVSLMRGRELRKNISDGIKKFRVHHLQNISPKKVKLMKQELEKLNKQLLLSKIHKKSVGKKQFIQVQQRLHQRKKEIEDQIKKSRSGS